MLLGVQQLGFLISASMVKAWEEILAECRAAYIDMLAAMLSDANPSTDDTRLKLVREFGGDATRELLSRMASHDERLADLMQRMSAVEGG